MYIYIYICIFYIARKYLALQPIGYKAEGYENVYSNYSKEQQDRHIYLGGRNALEG